MAPQNDLLRALSSDIRDKWFEHGHQLTLTVGQVFGEPRHPPSSVYFPVSAVLAWVNWLGDGASSAIALIGHEGMIALEPMHGLGQHLVTVCAGDVLKVPAHLVIDEARNNIDMSLLHLRNQQALLTQISQSAVCNQHHSVVQRLLRLWHAILLRIEGRTVQLTHEQMAQLLGTRRERVSQACAMLEKMGAIQQGRGRISLLDNQALSEQMCPCYGRLTLGGT